MGRASMDDGEEGATDGSFPRTCNRDINNLIRTLGLTPTSHISFSRAKHSGFLKTLLLHERIK